ncbi:MAG: acetate kinase [Bacteroidota bacterium]
MKILVINAGSSSVKFQVFNMPSEKPVCAGIAERIGSEASSISCKIYADGSEKFCWAALSENNLPIPDHGAAFQQILAILIDPRNGIIQHPDEIAVVGHRVVHGGEDFSEAALITPEVKQKIKALFSLAPLHNPVNYQCIEAAEKSFAQARQVAVFDTAFHQTMPERAFRYAIPNSYYQQEDIRAYGFHGISHQYVTQKAREILNQPDAKIISVHLGNGCSITAVEGGKSLDTSMGFGPLSGLVMGTRSGDMDPSIIFYLMNKLGLSAEQVNAMLNQQSGLLGLCGFSDMRDVQKAIQQGNKEAAFACELYAYRVRKYMGAYAAVLNGLDALIFTAGVGENAPYIRELICSNLSFLQIFLDQDRNTLPSQEIREINKVGAAVKILVIPTNEELEIARQCVEMDK